MCLAFSLIFAASTTSGDTLRSNRHGYDLDIPEGWVEIPKQVIRDVFDTVQRDDAEHRLTFDAGMQLDSGGNWLVYPYVLVQVHDYAAVGLNRQINEDEFADVATAVTGMPLEDGIDATLTPEAGEMIEGVSVSSIGLDREGRQFHWVIDMTVANVGPVRAMSVGHFGRDALVQIHFYCRVADWDGLSDLRTQIMDGFRFDSSKDYSEIVAERVPTPSKKSAGGLPVGVIGGAVSSVIMAIILGVYGTKSKKAKRQDAA